MSRWITVVVVAVVVLLLAAGGFAWWQQQQPPVEALVTGDVAPLGAAPAEIPVLVKARAGRLRALEVRLVQDGKERPLLQEDLTGRDLTTAERRVLVDAKALGLADGPAQVVVLSTDDAWRPRQPEGPRLVHDLTVDTTPPVLEFRAATRYMKRAGTGVAVYRARDAEQSGVRAGKREFRGVPGLTGDPEVHVALFTLPYDEEPAEPVLYAVDAAGNRRTTAVPINVLPDKELRDRVELKDDFLKRKVPELDPSVTSDDVAVLVDAFKKLNGEGRRQNERLIREKSREAPPSTALFRAPFRQQPDSKVMAGFPQERDYHRGGEIVDTQWHLGYDFASRAASPILATGAGRVLWTGDNGLYGNMVLVDHGLRLVSLYGHLSSIDVMPGQMVEAGESLGRSGTTGLAAGDHLHFAVLVDGTYTSPLDWFDSKYVSDRIATPLQEAGVSVPGITDLAPAKPPAPAGGERRRRR